MAIDLEGLQFKIESTIGDMSGIEKMIESLQKLKSAIKVNINFGDSGKQLKELSKETDNFPLDKLKQIAETDFSGLTSSFSELAKSAKELSDTPMKSLSQIGRAFQGNVNTQAIDELTQKLPGLAKSIEGLDTEKAVSASRLFNSFRAFKTIPDISTFRNQLENLLASVEKITPDKAKSIGSLIRSFGSFKEVGDISGVSAQLGSIATSVNGIDAEQMKEIAKGFRILGQFTTNADKTAQNIRTINQALSLGNPNPEFLNSLSKFNEVLTDMDNFATIRLQNIAVSLKAISTIPYRAIPDGFIDSIPIFVSLLNEQISTIDDRSLDILNSLSSILQEQFKGLGNVKLDPGFADSFKSLLEVVKNMDTSDSAKDKFMEFSRALSALSPLKEIKISSSIARQIEAVHNALTKLTDDDIKKLEALAKALSSLKNIGGLQKINVNTGSVKKANKETGKLKNIIPSFKTFGKDVGGAFKNIFTPIGKISGMLKDWIKDTAHIKKETKKLNSELKNFRKYGTATAPTPFKDSLKADLQKLSNKFKAVSQSVKDGVSRIKESIGETKLGKAFKEDVRTIQLDFKNLFSFIGENLSRVKESIGKTKLAKNLSSGVQTAKLDFKNLFSFIKDTGIGKILNIAFLTPLKGAFQLIGAVAKLAQNLQLLQGAANAAKFVFKNLFVAPLKGALQLGQAIGKALLSPVKKIAKSLKGAFLSFTKVVRARAYRAFLSTITSGFKEGIDNLYQYSKAINGEFARSMDTLATSMLYLKNSIGAAAAPIINQLAPAIDTLVDKIVDGINMLNQFNAKITGATTWTKALKYPKEYAEATDEASKAMKDFTMGFDELNVISESSSAKSADELDYSKMFQEVQLDQSLFHWVDNIEDAIESGNWYRVGAILGMKLNQVFDSIDYEGLGRKVGTGINNAISLAKGFLDMSDFSILGSGIAEFLNSAFDEISFYNLGAVIAGGFNSIFELINGFVKDFQFADFGHDLSEIVNGWGDTIDLNMLVEDFSLGLQGVLDTAYTFFADTRWKDLGSKFGEAFNQLVNELPSIAGKAGRTVSEFVKSVFSTLASTIERIDWKNTGSKLFESIKELFTNIDWSGISSSFAEFLGSAIGASVSLISGFIGEAKDAYDALYDWLSSGNVDAGEQFATWGEDNVVKPLLKGIVSGMYDDDTWKDFEDTIEEKGGMFGFFEGWGGYIYDEFHKGTEGAEEYGSTTKSVFEKLEEHSEKHKSKWSSFWQSVGGNVYSAGESIRNALKETRDDFKSEWNEFQEVFQIGMDTIVNAWKKFWNNWKTGFEEIKKIPGKIQQYAEDIIEGFKLGLVWEGVKAYLKEKLVDPFINGFKNLFGIHSPSTVMEEQGVYIIDGLKNGIAGSAWDELISTVSKNIADFIGNWKTGFEEIKNTVSEKWSSAKETVGTIGSTMWDSTKTAISDFTDNWKTGFSTIHDTVSEKWNSVKNTVSTVGSSMWDSTKTAVSDFTSNWSSGLSTIQETASQKLSNVKDTVSGAGTNLTAFSSDWKSGLETVSNSTSQTFNSMKNSVADTASTLWDDATSKLNSFKADWNTSLADIYSNVSAKSEEIAEVIKNPFKSIAEWFEKTFSDAWQRVQNVFSSGGEVFNGIQTGIADVFKGIVNHLIDGINSILHNSFQTINNALWEIKYVAVDGRYPFWEIPMVNIPEIPRFAEGGFPSSGDLFFANEAGYPEFVGSIGGKTAVANNDQITESVAQAVYQAVSNALAENQTNNGKEVYFNLYLDGRQIKADIEKSDRAKGQSIFGGGVVNGY